ncbi:MAG: hypothetical protein C0501_08995 [Isosphaera sp.]|nr:hypothetical protein [Isosphaera sp.]
MPNNPNDPDRKPASDPKDDPTDETAPLAPPPPEDSWADVPVAGLSGSEEIDFGPPAAAAADSWADVPVAGQSASEEIDLGRSSGVQLGANASDPFLAESSSDIIPEALPADPSSLNLLGGAVRPVAPASGWLTSDSGTRQPPPAAPPDAPEADIAKSPPPAVESSDVLADQYPHPAPPPVTGGSDVIVAAADESTSGTAAAGPRSSEVALLFDPPAGGSTVPVELAGDDLPLADDLPEADDFPEGDSLFDLGPSAELPFGPVETPPPGADAPDYGATPDPTHDASSILGDLAEPGRPEVDSDGSAVRIEAPGVGRTFPDPGGTEFDLTPVDDLPVPPELAAAAGGADPLAGGRTAPDLGLHDPDEDRTDEQPAPRSSIFAGAGPKPRGGSSDVALGESSVVPAEDDSSVEFSDHPSAEDEAAASRIFGPPSPSRSVPRKTPVPEPEPDPIAGMLDWGAGEADVLGADPAAAAGPPTGVLSGRGKGSAGPKTPAGKTGPGPGDEDDPSVEIDWLSGSSAEGPVVPADAPPTPPPAPAPAPARRARAVAVARPAPAPAAVARPARGRAGAWAGGTLVGAVVAAGACAGVYFGGLVPNAEPTAQAPQPRPQPGKTDPDPKTPEAPPPKPADVTAAVRAGDFAGARKIAAALPDTDPEVRAAVGEAELFAVVQAGKPDAAGLKAAREKLQAVAADAKADVRMAVKAAVQVGVAHELAGDRDAARKAYEDARARFPAYAATFDAALDRLAATAPAAAPPPPPEGAARRLAPADAHQLLLAVTLLQPDPKAGADEVEAGVHFWKAVNLAAGEKFAEAAAEIVKAKAAHLKQAKANPGRGLNPLSDPLEQIFARSCDDLKAYWELRAAIYGSKPVADLFKKDGADKAVAALAADRAAAAGVPGLKTDLKDASDKLAIATKDLKDTSDKLGVAMKELKVAGDLATDLKGEVKKEADAKAAAEKKLDAEEKARKAADDLVAAVAKELQGAKLLGEKFGPDELRAAQKVAAERATGPTLSALVPPGMMAVGGGGLSSAQLLDLAGRLTKSEAAVRAADAKLEAETKRLAADHTLAMKKLAEGHAAAVGKLKDDQTAELKAAAEKYVADAKKLTAGFEEKVRVLNAAVAAEKVRVAEKDKQIAADRENAVSPGQALDLWLPILVELRRASDAEEALRTARKAQAAAPPGSADAGKARTVAGLALLFKGDLAGAKAEFEAARANPAHGPAAREKVLWATAADVGLASVTDRQAPFRRPVELPRRDAAAAARALDAGITAYKLGRYSDAAASLAAAVDADPTDALGWYFLGAARWGLGSTDQARDDFRQGAVRELASTVPTRVVNAALAPIQGPVRDALTAARP